MYGMVYSASFTAQTYVTSAQDAFEITAPSDAVVVLLGCSIGQSSDAGDAEAEMLTVNIVRYATGGSGGAAASEIPHQVGFAAAGAAVETNNSTQGGTPTVIHSETFNVQASPGWLYKPSPEERIVVSPSGILAVELPDAPADSLTISGTITWMEIGG